MGFRDCTCVPALHDLGAPCMTFTLLFSHISAQREDPDATLARAHTHTHTRSGRPRLVADHTHKESCTKIARAETCSFLPISQSVSVFNFVHLFYTKGLLP